MFKFKKKKFKGKEIVKEFFIIFLKYSKKSIFKHGIFKFN
jgi:hypothetical protein